MGTPTQDEYRWSLPRYNPPGLLIGPILYIKNSWGHWVPDWSRPGVKERIRVEVDFHEDEYGVTPQSIWGRGRG